MIYEFVLFFITFSHFLKVKPKFGGKHSGFTLSVLLN